MYVWLENTNLKKIAWGVGKIFLKLQRKEKMEWKTQRMTKWGKETKRRGMHVNMYTDKYEDVKMVPIIVCANLRR